MLLLGIITLSYNSKLKLKLIEQLIGIQINIINKVDRGFELNISHSKYILLNYLYVNVFTKYIFVIGMY